MSTRDLWIRDFTTRYGLLLAGFVLVGFWVARRWTKIRERFFRSHLMGFEAECATLANGHKRHLLRPLEKMSSADEVLRKLGQIRVLEIGVKTGLCVSVSDAVETRNFSLLRDKTRHFLSRTLAFLVSKHFGENIRFYPTDCRLIGVDWNRRLAEFLVDSDHSWRFAHVLLERLIVGDGSSLKGIPSGSCDAVVTTRALCSARWPRTALREIRRVLVPGGKYFFMEHTTGQKGSLVWSLQSFLTRSGIWPAIFEGCRLDSDPIGDIMNAGFLEVSWRPMTLQGCVSQPFHLFLTQHHVIGTAVR